MLSFKHAAGSQIQLNVGVSDGVNILVYEELLKLETRVECSWLLGQLALCNKVV